MRPVPAASPGPQLGHCRDRENLSVGTAVLTACREPRDPRPLSLPGTCLLQPLGMSSGTADSLAADPLPGPWTPHSHRLLLPEWPALGGRGRRELGQCREGDGQCGAWRFWDAARRVRGHATGLAGTSFACSSETLFRDFCKDH